MHLHYLTLSRQTAHLRPLLTGVVITDSYTHRKNEWVITLSRARQEAGALQLCCDGQFPYILHLDHSRRAANSTGVMEEISGWEITGITIMPGERIIEITFRERGSGYGYSSLPPAAIFSCLPHRAGFSMPLKMPVSIWGNSFNCR